jgi:hypothetical protein
MFIYKKGSLCLSMQGVLLGLSKKKGLVYIPVYVKLFVSSLDTHLSPVKLIFNKNMHSDPVYIATKTFSQFF